MDSVMASELTRLKSRDFAIQNTEEVYDRPEMATPKSRGQDTSKIQSVPRPAIMVEDRFPDWQGKPVSQTLSPERAGLSTEPHSMYAQSIGSIPPLPELPADVPMKGRNRDCLGCRSSILLYVTNTVEHIMI